MILFLLLVLHVNGLTAQTNPPSCLKRTVDLSKKPVLFTYIEPDSYTDDDYPKMQPESIPLEWEVIVFQSIYIDTDGIIVANTDVLKSLTSHKSVIGKVQRLNGYYDWALILSLNGNDTDANILIEFAKSNQLSGYLLDNVNPNPILNEEIIPGIAQYFAPYLKKLKYCKEFVVGMVVGPDASLLQDPTITDFVAVNEVVDFYEINTSIMNVCDYENKMRDRSPVKPVTIGQTRLLSLEDVTASLKATQCNMNKVYFVADVFPVDMASSRVFDTYSIACKTNDTCTWCIPRTTDCFIKGLYIKQNNYGLMVEYANCDDVDNACGCSPFVMTQNVLAGYGGNQIVQCKKIDDDPQCP